MNQSPAAVAEHGARRDAVTAAYTQRWGAGPAGVWDAPGRVNLIGEHTDYNDGFVMPFALTRSAMVAAARRDDGRIVVTSLDLDETVETSVDDLVPFDAPGAAARVWADYLTGCVWALREAGHQVGGVNLVLECSVPIGAGLSSSAALECATVAALVDLYGLDIDPMERAVLARRCENAYVGAPTGLLDQAASTLCTLGHTLFMDCRSLETQQVPMDFASVGLEMLVLDTMTPHSHVDGEYSSRRATCEKAAGLLGVPALRDVDDLAAALATLAPHGDELVKRTRHVVTENHRVLEAIDLARAGRVADLGPLLDASHASMRDDFEITVPTVDLAVETARAHGALGARMTGGGFGGCIIALVPEGTADRVGQAIAKAFAGAGFGAPKWFSAVPSAGARRIA
ncbi:galactokinase [Propionibacteriaceae bacterium G57]|uniref:galactokinase n=1 Tax=Aestuariimicrobium sp. G57 TaxID=3418485 RepID=UPI003DA71789